MHVGQHYIFPSDMCTIPMETEKAYEKKRKKNLYSPHQTQKGYITSQQVVVVVVVVIFRQKHSTAPFGYRRYPGP